MHERLIAHQRRIYISIQIGYKHTDSILEKKNYEHKAKYRTSGRVPDYKQGPQIQHLS